MRNKITQGMGDNLNPTRTANPKIFPRKKSRKIFLGAKAETFGYQATERVTAGEGSNPSFDLREGDRNTPG
jgi:hypothetical protein